MLLGESKKSYDLTFNVIYLFTMSMTAKEAIAVVFVIALRIGLRLSLIL